MSQLTYYKGINEYSVLYSVLTMVSVLLLLWYFIRSEIDYNCRQDYMMNREEKQVLDLLPEFKDDFYLANVMKKQTNAQAESRTKVGMYGDVPIKFVNIKDSQEYALYDNKYMIVDNMRTVYQKTDPLNKWHNV